MDRSSVKSCCAATAMMVVCLVFVGCSAGDETAANTNNDAGEVGDANAPTVDDGGSIKPGVDSGGADATSTNDDGGGKEAGPHPCGAGTVDIGGGRGGGIRGTITMPTAVPPELVGIQIGIYDQALVNFSIPGSYGGPAKTTYTFEAPTPDANGYWLSASAHADFSNPAFDEKDYRGFYAGTPAKLVGPWDSVKITPSTPPCGVDIIIGKPVCYVEWGQPCTTDKQCRSFVCECNGGAKITQGSCNIQTNLCERPPNATCTAAMCGAAGLKGERQASCFNN